MNCLKVLRYVKNYQTITASKRRQLISTNIKYFSFTSNLKQSKDPKSDSFELEERFKRIISEYGNPSSSLKPLIDSWISKPWILFSGEKTKSIQIKERKETTGLKDGMFRMAFDLPGFKAEEIRIIVSNNKLYIEAKKEEITNDGSKACRELSFECISDKNLNPNTVRAYLDSEGLLVIDAEVPKETLTGVKKPPKE